MNAALAIFGHQRPGSIRRLLSSVEKNSEFFDSQVYAFIDGPRNAIEAKVSQEIKDIFLRLNHPRLEIIARQTNVGLKRSIIDGVNYVFEKEDAVIVLEDDLVLSSKALSYFNDGLSSYRDNNIVASITSHTFLHDKSYSNERAFFLPSPHPWGWATWKNRWENVDWNSKLDKEIINSPSFKTYFNSYGLRDFSRMLKLAELGLVNSWYIYWCYHCAKNNQLTMYPPLPYSRNEGASSAGGTHSSRFNPYDVLVPKPTLAERKFTYPQCVVIDYPELDRAISSKESKSLRLISRLGEIKRRAKYFVNKLK